MEKEEFIKFLGKTIDMLYDEKNAVGNSGFDNTYCQIQTAKKEGAIEALSALKYVLTH